MSDRERAARVVSTWCDATTALESLLAEVRRDERRRAVAWLRAEAPTRRVEVQGLIHGLADDLERGDHILAVSS